MARVIASNIMPRTTLDIDASVLRELKRRAKAAGKSLGDLVSELLAPIIRRDTAGRSSTIEWRSQPMRARIDLEDSEAIYKALDNR